MQAADRPARPSSPLLAPPTCRVVRLCRLLQRRQLRLVLALDGARLPLKLLPQPAGLLGIVQPARERGGAGRHRDQSTNYINSARSQQEVL